MKSSQESIHVFSKKEALSCYKPILYLCGFQEGKWPDRLLKSPFLSHKEHDRLKLSSSHSHYLFHLYLMDIAQSQSQYLTFSYSAQSDGSTLSPSHFLRYCKSVQKITHYDTIRMTEQDYQVQLGLSDTTPITEPSLGMIHSGPSLSHLHTFFDQKPLSATSLDLYQSCPYAFFYKDLLHFKQKDPFPASLTPIDWGTIVHDLLYSAYKQAALPNKSLFLSVLESCLKKATLDPFAHALARSKLLGTETKPGLIDWVVEDQTSLPAGFRPIHLEYLLEGDETCYQLALK